MNLGINMNTPERVEMAKEAKSIQQRAEIEVLESFADEGAWMRETPDELRARWDRQGGYKAELYRRYRISRRNYANGIM